MKMRRNIAQECSLLVVLFLIAVGVFYAIPIFQILVGSFTKDSGIASTGESYAAFSNYVSAFRQSDLRQTLLTTMVFTVGTVSIQITLAFAAAVLTTRSYRAVGFLRAMFIAPYFLPTVVVVIAWRFIADPFVGILPTALRWLGISPPDLQGPTAALPVMILVATYEAFPFTYVILLARMKNIPVVLYEMAELDGAGAFRRFVSVTWPQVRLTLWGLILLRVLITWLKFDVPWLVYASNAQSPWGDTLAVRVYRLGFQSLQRGDAYALSLTVIVAAWGCYALWTLLSNGQFGRRHRLEQLASGGR
jgi:multiple sugar transport system permease protein